MNAFPVPPLLMAGGLFVLGLLAAFWPYGFVLSPLWGSLLLLGVGIGVLLGLAARVGASRPRVVAGVLLGAMMLGEAVFLGTVRVLIDRPYPLWPWMVTVNLVLAILALAVAAPFLGAPAVYLLVVALLGAMVCLVSVPGFALGARLVRPR